MTRSNFLSKVFLWMFIGLMVTFLTGVVVAGNAQALEFIFNGNGYIYFAIAELITVIILSIRIHNMSPIGARLGFIFYSFLSGLTFSSIFIIFEISSIITMFLITSIIMLIFSIIGATTKIDLAKFETYLLMILIAIVIALFINKFVASATFDIGITIVSLIVFIIFIACDVQKVLRLYDYNQDTENLAIFGALQLYLDFINILLDLLKLFGKHND